MNDPLFTPWQFGSLALKNSILMPAMHLNMAEGYQVTDKLCAFYAERAQGGGGGKSVALAARHHGHKVRLYEADPRLGGQLDLAGAPPGSNEFQVLARNLAHQVQTAGVEICLGSEVTAELQIPCDLIGNARSPAIVFDAVHQGYQAGMKVV